MRGGSVHTYIHTHIYIYIYIYVVVVVVVLLLLLFFFFFFFFFGGGGSVCVCVCVCARVGDLVGCWVCGKQMHGQEEGRGTRLLRNVPFQESPLGQW